MEPEIDLETEEETQLTPEESKASLGLSTRLSEQFLQAQAPEGGEVEGQGEQEGKTEETMPPNWETKTESMIDKKLAEFKQDLLGSLEEDEQETETDTKA